LGDVLAHSLEPDSFRLEDAGPRGKEAGDRNSEHALLHGNYASTSIFDQLGKDSNRYRIEQNISPNSHLYYILSERKEPTLKKYAFELDNGHDHCGYLVVLAVEQSDVVPVDETQILAIEKAVEAANIEMSKVRASIDAEMRLMGNLFTLLNSGNLTHQQAIRRASFLQIDLTAGFIVCIVDLIHAVEEAASCTIEQLMERAFSMSKRIALAYFPGSLVALDGKRVNILLVPPAGIDPMRRRGLIGSTVERIAQGLEGIVPVAKFRIGTSSFHDDAAEVNIAYNEAITAALVSTATGRTNGVTNFRDLGLYKLLLHVNRSHPEEAREFYSDALGTIEEYDQKREGDLLHTLAMFFASRENINDTAAKLFTHRHTIRYRLQRIAELSGLDPFDPDDREVLRIAVKLKQLISLVQS
jgi:sugar diacid utilization regulator